MITARLKKHQVCQRIPELRINNVALAKICRNVVRRRVGGKQLTFFAPLKSVLPAFLSKQRVAWFIEARRISFMQGARDSGQTFFCIKSEPAGVKIDMNPLMLEFLAFCLAPYVQRKMQSGLVQVSVFGRLLCAIDKASMSFEIRAFLTFIEVGQANPPAPLSFAKLLEMPPESTSWEFTFSRSQEIRTLKREYENKSSFSRQVG